MDKRNSPDRISALPDSLIHTILSFIDMRYAVQSSVLSKRWRYIWTSLPVLNFGFVEGSSVADFIDKVLWFRDSCCIQKFFLHGHEDFDSTRIYSWIAVAVRRNVEEILIDCSWNGDFVMPPCLCTCKSLTDLSLCIDNSENVRGKITLPSLVSLPRLKSMDLTLVNLFFDDEYSTNKFFSSCPALESLYLDNCRFSDMNLSISSLSLKSFDLSINVSRSMNLDTSSFTDTPTLTLCSPNLATFICFNYMLRDYSLENLSSLATAHLSIEIETYDTVPENEIELLPEKKEIYARHMMKLVRALHNVTSLTLSEYFKVISEAPEILNNQLPQFLNLRSLCLTTWLSRDCMHAIIFLLKISPNIEYLCLDLLRYNPQLFPFCDEINFDSRSQEDYWDSGLMLPCVLYHLKFVKIEGLQGCVNELKFIEILLKNCMVLEKMVLFSNKRSPRVRTEKRVEKKNDPHAERRMKKFYEILLTFPRALTCTIVLDPSEESGATLRSFCNSFDMQVSKSGALVSDS